MVPKVSVIVRVDCTVSQGDTWQNLRHVDQIMSSMPTVHCALFKMAAAGMSKRLKGSSLKSIKKNQFAR